VISAGESPVQSRDLEPARLAAVIATRRLGRNYLFVPACGSSSDEVSGHAAAGAEEGLLVATDQQSKGRGRRGRSWHSPPGENLYFSLLLQPALDARRIAPLPLVAGAALAQALVVLGFSPRLKWPNDVLLDATGGPRKVAGILAEMASENGRVRHLVLGIGVNVNAREFPSEIVERATSLRLVRGAKVDRLQVLAGFLAAFEPLYEQFVVEGTTAGLAAWRRHASFGQPCWVQSGSQRIEGVAEAVGEDGALLMRTSDGNLVPVHAGEVNWEKPR
jgi:BirA family transcriptional regulator, biotin operon repressor / biotin---[acetyl-CoA-carboxylase] ligase